MAVTNFPSVAIPNTSAQRQHVTTTPSVSKTSSITQDVLLFSNLVDNLLLIGGGNLNLEV